MIRHLCAACNIRVYLFMYCVHLIYHCVCLCVTDFLASMYETESVKDNSFLAAPSRAMCLSFMRVCSLSLFNALRMYHPLCLTPMCVCAIVIEETSGSRNLCLIIYVFVYTNMHINVYMYINVCVCKCI